MPRTGQPRGNSQRFWVMARGGPMTIHELDGPPASSERRVYDMRQFNPYSFTTAVWYLGEFHDPANVLNYWFSENLEALRRRDVSRRSLSYKLSGAFSDAWSEIRDEPRFDWLDPETGEREESEARESQCPRCEQEGIKNLPNHLRGCDGEPDDE